MCCIYRHDEVCRVLTKLGNIAGYQQLIVPTSDASTKMQSNSEQEELFEDFECDALDQSICVDRMNTRPRFSLLDDYSMMNVTPQYIELTVNGVYYRFTHPPANVARQFTVTKGLPPLPADKSSRILIPGVILQGKPQQQQQYLDAYEVDLYIEFEAPGITPLTTALGLQGYVRIV